MEIGYVYILIILFGLISLFGLYLFIKDYKLVRDNRSAVAKKYIADLTQSIDDPKFFSTGHPYCWVEMSKEELLKMFSMFPPSESQGHTKLPLHSIKIDRNLGNVFVVFNEVDYDFVNSNLVTYDQYIGKTT